MREKRPDQDTQEGPERWRVHVKPTEVATRDNCSENLSETEVAGRISARLLPVVSLQWVHGGDEPHRRRGAGR